MALIGEDVAKRIKLTRKELCPEIPGIRFNPTIIESGDGYLVACRNAWKVSDLYAFRLDRDFKSTGAGCKLDLKNGGASVGREDGRWFRIDGQLYISFTGFCGSNTHVQYARINEDSLTVERIYWPVMYTQMRREKNHSYFDYQGQPHAVYSISPHQIIKAPLCGEGEDPVTSKEHVTPFTGTWSGGTMRGGASPVLHNGVWYSFFHGHTIQDNGRRLYNIGCYTFSPKPPFQILSYTPEPFAIADPKVTPAKGVPVDVIFPGGAVLVNGQWVIAMGVNDLHSEIRFYDCNWIESLLVAHGA